MSNKLISRLNELQLKETINLGEVCDSTGQHSLLLIALICVLPFMQPIPLPGLSTFFGSIIFLQGLGLCLKGQPLMTKNMRALTLDQKKFNYVLMGAKKVLWVSEKCSLFQSSLLDKKVIRVLSGLFIMGAAFFLALPLPIPFSNFIPALCIFLICLAHLENDLFLLILGYLMIQVVGGIALFSFVFIKELGLMLIK